MSLSSPTRTRSLVLAILASATLAAPAFANEICETEFKPMIEAHQRVMQQTQAAIPRTRPTTFEQARSNAQRACAALTNAQASFERLKTWVTNNADFCRLPEQIVNDVTTGTTNVSRNRTQACNGVAQLDRQRRQAEAGGGGGANPFAPNAGRRPQLDLRTPGAL